jgi:hypothetical protein
MAASSAENKGNSNIPKTLVNVAKGLGVIAVVMVGVPILAHDILALSNGCLVNP